MPADAAGASRDDDDLPRPVVLVLDPVVQHAPREVVVDPPEQAKRKQRLEARVGRGVQDGQVLALLGVFGQQQQRQDQLRVERCVADDLEHRVALEALAGEEAIVHRHCKSCCSSDVWWVMCEGRKSKRRGSSSHHGLVILRETDPYYLLLAMPMPSTKGGQNAGSLLMWEPAEVRFWSVMRGSSMESGDSLIRQGVALIWVACAVILFPVGLPRLAMSMETAKCCLEKGQC